MKSEGQPCSSEEAIHTHTERGSQLNVGSDALVRTRTILEAHRVCSSVCGCVSGGVSSIASVDTSAGLVCLFIVCLSCECFPRWGSLRWRKVFSQRAPARAVLECSGIWTTHRARCSGMFWNILEYERWAKCRARALLEVREHSRIFENVPRQARAVRECSVMFFRVFDSVRNCFWPPVVGGFSRPSEGVRTHFQV